MSEENEFTYQNYSGDKRTGMGEAEANWNQMLRDYRSGNLSRDRGSWESFKTFQKGGLFPSDEALQMNKYSSGDDFSSAWDREWNPIGWKTSDGYVSNENFDPNWTDRDAPPSGTSLGDRGGREGSGFDLFGERESEFDDSFFEGVSDEQKQRAGEYYRDHGRGEQVGLAEGLLDSMVGGGNVLSSNPQQEDAMRSGEHKSGATPDTPYNVQDAALGVYSAQHSDASGPGGLGSAPDMSGVEGLNLSGYQKGKMGLGLLGMLTTGMITPMGLASLFGKPILGSLWSSFKNSNFWKSQLSDPSDVLAPPPNAPDLWSSYGGFSHGSGGNAGSSGAGSFGGSSSGSGGFGGFGGGDH